MRKFLRIMAASIAIMMAASTSPVLAAEDTYDIVVYGGNAAGIMAAVQAVRLGKTVAVIEPGKWIGGLTTGGLGDTDFGNASVIGGVALEFYKKLGQRYGTSNPVWAHEAKVATAVLQEYVSQNNIPVFYEERLDLNSNVTKDGTNITSIKMESGKVFKGKMFIDATYEGDLMAKSGVSYFIGRESNSVYNETINGINRNSGLHMPDGIDAYVVKGDPSSGLLPRVNEKLEGSLGSGDRKIQAYNYRWNLTKNPANRVMVQKPDEYNELDFEILIRALEAGMKADLVFKTGRRIPNEKYDNNNNSSISTDYVGMSYDYVEADYEERAKIAKAHEIYQRGLLWTVQNHPRVPKDVRDYFADWGLCADEFTDNNNWPTQLYVREARKMVSDFVITQDVCELNVPVYDTVGMGSYAMDSHVVQYYVNDKGHVTAEGGFYTTVGPYPISYRSIVPKIAECTNLFVPVCLSASHAAYGSARMEPVFMVLAQSSATAASIAIDDGIAIQDVEYGRLRAKLVQDGQVLEYGTPPGMEEIKLGSTFNFECETVEAKTNGPTITNFDFVHCSNGRGSKLDATAVGDYIEYTINVPEAGTYNVSTQINMHNSRGKFKLFMPATGTYVGGEHDQYSSEVGTQKTRIKEVEIGEIKVSQAGNVTLRFEVTGKSPESSGYTLAFDTIKISNNAVDTSVDSDQLKAKMDGAVVLFLGSSDALVGQYKTKIDLSNKEVMPIIKEGRTLVPVRFISEGLLASVRWNQEKQSVTIRLDGKVVEFVVGSKTYKVDGVSKELDVPPEIINERTMLPLRALSEAVNKTVFWDDRGLIVVSGEPIFDSAANPAEIQELIKIFN